MIKLFILNEISGFSSDTVYKICLSLEEKGLTDEGISRFPSYEELLDALIPALEAGDHVLVAMENSMYLDCKKDICTKLMLEESASPIAAEIIAKSYAENFESLDIAGHSSIPAGAKILFSDDGLYNGFSLSILDGKLTLIPLDFERVDTILPQLREKVIEREERLAEMGLDREIDMPEQDIIPCVTDMVSALKTNGRKIALATGDATMWVYNLYDRVDDLTEVVHFVEVVDDPETADDNESESAMLIRHAREAMLNVGADYGGAISDIYSTQTRDGETQYFALAAVVDRNTASAKKVNITDPDKLAVVLPTALTLMTEMVKTKIEAAYQALFANESTFEPYEPYDYSDQSEPEKKGFNLQNISPRIVLFGICALIAVILPIILVFSVFNEDEPTTVPFVPTTPSITTTAPTTENPFGGQTTTGPIGSTSAEPTVTDVSANTTVAVRPSESGMFTFYVFGYGHGVGMSQHGANALANQGWNYAEILAHYYYDGNTQILQGDTYPETIKYAGSEYKTRDYLAKALDAEMGSSFHAEALKAQAVAIYTFAKYYSYNLDSSAHAFTANTPGQAIYDAVDFVMNNGLYISYAGDVAVTPFHSMSAGVTTSYYNVWGQSNGAAPPYLSGGRQSPGDLDATNYRTTFTISSADIKKLIEEKDSSITLTGDPSTWISVVTHDRALGEDIGYVSTINVGGKLVTGNDFRTKLMGGKIRSHCFVMVYTPDA